LKAGVTETTASLVKAAVRDTPSGTPKHKFLVTDAGTPPQNRPRFLKTDIEHLELATL
jgi:hypothetical protein